MDMLDRYLQAVKFFLPARQQDDIVRELAENLISQIEDREEELGRPLDESEQAAILRQHGHPMMVAGRYRSRQQLIGPVFFPLYLFSLKLGLGVALLVTVVLTVVGSALHGDPLRHALDAMQAYPGRALMVFAWTTLGFAALDFAQARLRIGSDWDPRNLPRVVVPNDQISRLRTMCELVFQLVVLVWFLLLPGAPFLMLGPAAAIVEFGEVARMAYVPLLLLILATAALHLVDFIRPYWTRQRVLMRVAVAVTSLIVFTLLAAAEPLFVTAIRSEGARDAAAIERLVSGIDAGFRIGFAVAAMVSIIEIVKLLRQLKHRSIEPISSGSTPARAGR